MYIIYQTKHFVNTQNYKFLFHFTGFDKKGRLSGASKGVILTVTYKMHFIRTGSTSVETEKRYVGQSDPPLCPEGMEKLEDKLDTAEYPRVQAVFTSPLRRCVQTADILYPDTFTETVEGLMDMNLGDFEGYSFGDLQGNEDFIRWLDNSAENPPPGGEEAAAFTIRIVQAVQEIFRRMMDQQLRSVAVVTHGGVIMSLLAAIGLPKLPLQRWAVSNGDGYTLLFTPQMWMRDGCAEVFAAIPTPFAKWDEDEKERYFTEG